MAKDGRAQDERKLVAGLDIADLRQLLLTEDRGLVHVVLKFKKVMKGIFQKKRGMFKTRARVAVSRLLIKV